MCNFRIYCFWEILKLKTTSGDFYGKLLSSINFSIYKDNVNYGVFIIDCVKVCILSSQIFISKIAEYSKF